MRTIQASPGSPRGAEGDTLTLWNQLHADLLRAVGATRGPAAGDIEIIGLGCDGVDIRSDRRILHLDFGQPVATAGAALDTLRLLAGASPA